MRRVKVKTGTNNRIHKKVPLSHAKEIRPGRPRSDGYITVGHVDLPVIVSNGVCYIQAPLPHIFEAFGESLPEFLRDMEIGIPETRGSALSPDDIWRAISRSIVVKSRLVPDRRVR